MERRNPSAKQGLQTAVRSLQPQELFALTAENERLMKLEKDLQARESALALKDQSSSEEALRLKAQNEELRRELDMAMLNGGGGGAELAGLRKQLQEVEARRVLERSEDAAKLATLEASHAHATSLLSSLQASHDEAVAGRSAAERERDRLADLLARTMQPIDEDGDVSTPSNAAASSSSDGAARAAVHESLLVHELSSHEIDADGTIAALRQALEHAERFHATAMDAKGRELARAIEQVHRHLAGTLAVDVATRVLRAEIGLMETDAQESVRRAAQEGERCREALADAARAAEAQMTAETESARLSTEAAEEQRAAEATRAQLVDASERARALQQRYEAAVAQSLSDAQRLEAVEAARVDAKARIRALENELAASRAAVQRGTAQVGRLEEELAGRDELQAKAIAQLKAKQKEAVKMREALLKEAVQRAEAARTELGELQAQMDEAAGDEERARDGEELAMNHVSRLEKQLEAIKKEISRKDDQLQAMARRLEVLAQANTESHKHDMGCAPHDLDPPTCGLPPDIPLLTHRFLACADWGERARRSEFATAAFTVGSSKRAAQKVAQAAMVRARALDGAPTRMDATSDAAGSILPPLKQKQTPSA